MEPITLDNPDLLELLAVVKAAGSLRIDTEVSRYCTILLLDAIGEQLFARGGIDELAALRRLRPDHPVRQLWLRRMHSDAAACREQAEMYELAIKNLESLPDA